MSAPMPDNKTLETFLTSGHIFMINIVPSGSPPKYNVMQQSKKTGKVQILGQEIPYNQCLDILRKKKALKQKSHI